MCVQYRAECQVLKTEKKMPCAHDNETALLAYCGGPIKIVCTCDTETALLAYCAGPIKMVCACDTEMALLA